MVYDISYKTLLGPKPLRIRFDKIDVFKHLISKKSGITNSINYDFGKIRIDSYNALPIEKLLTFHYVILLIKSVVNKDKDNYNNI